MQHWFKDWFNSPYYHKLYAHRDDREAASFIDRLISHLKPAKGSRMLDVGCGKGRHALRLASKGFDVTGIDLSEKSIEEARQSENDKIRFFVHDMRRPCWINYFDYAFNFFTSFGYFESLREHNDALKSIAASLRKGGIFVMDFLNVAYAETHLKSNSDEEKDECLFIIRRTADAGHFIKEITVKDKKTGETFSFTEKVAKFKKKELAEMLNAQGLDVIETFGDYSLSAYDEDNSPRLILVSRKSG